MTPATYAFTDGVHQYFVYATGVTPLLLHRLIDWDMGYRAARKPEVIVTSLAHMRYLHIAAVALASKALYQNRIGLP